MNNGIVYNVVKLTEIIKGHCRCIASGEVTNPVTYDLLCKSLSEIESLEKQLIQQAEAHADHVESLAIEIETLKQDKDRLDWLADRNNKIGNVQLPTECIINNLDSMRGAIDEAMRIDNEKA